MTADAPLFLDTSFFIALQRREDENHEKSTRWARRIRSGRLRQATTLAVLWEALNGMASPRTRRQALRLYREVLSDPTVEVVGFEPELQDAALALYAERHDKAWGIVDCFSFVVMRERGITAALTADRHFEQAGFEALLLHNGPA